MPIIQVKLIEDVFSPAQKKQLIEKLTDAMAAVYGEKMRPVTWVLLEDIRSGDWGIGGKPMTSDMFRTAG